MNYHPESTVQYSGSELEGGARDVTALGRVIAELRFEYSADAGQGSDLEQARRRAQMHDEDPAFREQPPAATQ